MVASRYRDTCICKRAHTRTRQSRQDLVGAACATKHSELVLQHTNVGNEAIHDLRPRTVERLVPDRGLKACDVELAHDVAHDALLLREHRGAHVGWDQIHLVYETKDFGFVRVSLECFNTHGEILDVLLHLAALDVKDVYEHRHVAENVVSLRLKVGLHVRILSTAVPEVEDEVPKESNVRMLNVLRNSTAKNVRAPR